MKKYETYKNSGIEWIGQIPTEWEQTKFKYFVEQITLPSKDANKVALENIESKTGRYVPTDSEFEGNGVSFEKDDILYGKLRPYLQKVWRAEFAGNAVGDIFVYRAKTNSVPRYVQYVFLSENFTSAANGSTYGAKMPRVSSEYIASSVWFLPSLSEQQAIADYLDEKVGQIDKSVADIDKQIEDLKAYRQSVISEAVTKGLNPNAPMKDSGIEWLGVVPEMWTISKLKYEIICLDGQRVPVEKSQRENGPYPYWGAGSITCHVNNYLFDEELVLLGEDGAPFFDPYRPVAFYVKEKIWVNNHIHVLKAGDRIMPKYLSYYLNSVDYHTYINGSVLNKLTQNSMNDIHVTLPSLQEQNQISDYLDDKTSKIDSSIKSLEVQRDDLNALRQTIISEAVTGKIDVRNWKIDK